MDKIENPIVECQMMIRKPISEVFQAFVDPTITTKFWFTSPVEFLKRRRVLHGNGKCMVFQIQ